MSTRPRTHGVGSSGRASIAPLGCGLLDWQPWRAFMTSRITRSTARLCIAGLVVLTSMSIGSSAFAVGVADPGSCADGGACQVGDAGPGGGVVFFDAGSRESWGRYLEVAPSGWSGAPSDPVATWCAEGKAGFTARVRTGTALGSGAADTSAIVKACGSASAARSVNSRRSRCGVHPRAVTTRPMPRDSCW
jgi:hypothetical protein